MNGLPRKEILRTILISIARERGLFFPRRIGRRAQYLEWMSQNNVTFDDVAKWQLSNTPKVEQQRDGLGDNEQRQVKEIVGDMLTQFNRPTVDMVEVEAQIKTLIDKMSPREVVVALPSGEKVKIDEHLHPMFEKVLRLVQAGLNVLLVGPAGCGKSTLVEQIARSMKRTFGMLSCTSGASESQLTGWLLPVSDGGKFTYVASEFVTLYEKGNSVFLLDEIDAADPNMLLVINAALANGHMSVPQRHEKPIIKRGKNAAIVAAANTFGSGNDIQYAGRNQLDAATLDRFYVVKMDYDAMLEAKIAGAPAPVVTPWAATTFVESSITAIYEWINNVRSNVAASRLRRVVSTRWFQKAVAALRAGISLGEVKQDLLAGWSIDEMRKVGVA